MVDAVKPTGNRKIEDVTMHGTGDGQMWMAHTKDGKQVHLRPSTLGYSNPKPPTPEMARSILNGVADAYEADPSPNGPPEVVYHSVEGYGRLLAARGDADTEGGFSRAQKVRASVFSNVPGRINVITDVLAEPYSNNTGPQASITFSKDRVAMTMLHEYGHLRFFEGLTKDRLAKTTAVFKNPKVKATLSNYGLRNHLEAEADSYAEWHVTGGHTNNLAAQAYGEVLGWKKT